VDFSAVPSLQRGGVSGRVFLDLNGNGEYDPGEQQLPGVRVVVGPTFGLSDSAGAYRVWDLLPFEPTPVTVDSATLASPLWVPGFAGASVVPSPNRYRRLDIPVLPGGVVEGRVSWVLGLPRLPADGRTARPMVDSVGQPTDSMQLPAVGSAEDRPGAGITLVLRHRASGEQRVVSTFTDGTFYLIGVRPGEWELSVDPKCLSVLGARAEPVRFTVRSDADGDTVSGLEVDLTP
jgi:hypothetical protein